ncbi:hypothetical protein AMTRI_Chr06g196830 [Amborella trichopoda]
MASIIGPIEGAIVNVVGKYVVDPLHLRCNYSVHLEENVETLVRATNNLKAMRDNKQHDIDAAEINAVSVIEAKVAAIEEEYRNRKTCLRGLCIDCPSRYRLSERALKLKREVDQRLAAQFELTRAPPPVSVFDGINDKSYSIIGVYGIGGVGKTTLLMNINNRFKEQPSFDTVIVVTVSATTNILNIQKKIGKRLGLDLSSCGEEDSKDKLLGALRRKKYLWHELKLESIGIPRPKNESGCKILVSSRNQDVCTDTGAEFIIEVKKLSEAEAWRLFIKRAGENVTSPSIKPHAGTLLKKCEGPPLAINTVAHAMENRHTIGEGNGRVPLRGMKEKVLDCLKFSYDRLESDMHESLFLFCALFPENCSIHRYELAVLCIGEGLVDRLGSLRATHNKVATLVGSLKSSCMLENGEEEGEVRMHDIIHQKFLVREGASLREAPDATEWEAVDRISLSENELEFLPELSQGNNNNETLAAIPSQQVVSLNAGTRIESLPSSLPLSHLVDLRVLILRGCSCLQELPPIGRLQQLQVLDLWCCKNLKTMPDGMGDISKLRYLNLSVTTFEIHKGCEGLEEVIEEDNNNDGPSPLSLTLSKLITLRSICGKCVLFCPLIYHVMIEECPQLEKEPLDVYSANGALVIKGDKWEGEVVQRES